MKMTGKWQFQITGGGKKMKKNSQDDLCPRGVRHDRFWMYVEDGDEGKRGRAGGSRRE